ncbi:MAG: type II CAAX prenyl endopeptidase Rce1 family protein [Bacteroidota bacterium]
MSLNTPTGQHPFIFFISKFLILGGMMLVFTFVSMGVGMVLSKYIFGIDIFSTPELLYDYSNPLAVQALKLIQACYAIGGFLLPALLFPRSFQQDGVEYTRLRVSASSVMWVLSVGLFVVSLPLINQLVVWNEGVVLPPSLAHLESQFKAAELAAKQLTEAFLKTDSFLGLLLNLLLVAILPAICEELLFRGALMHFLLQCFYQKHLAIWFSAILFSLFHAQFYGFVPRMLLGVLLGYMVWYSGSIWPAMVIHFINNAIATLASFYDWENSSFQILQPDYTFPLAVVVLSAFLTVSLVIMMYKKNKQQNLYNGE